MLDKINDISFYFVCGIGIIMLLFLLVLMIIYYTKGGNKDKDE